MKLYLVRAGLFMTVLVVELLSHTPIQESYLVSLSMAWVCEPFFCALFKIKTNNLNDK